MLMFVQVERPNFTVSSAAISSVAACDKHARFVHVRMLYNLLLLKTSVSFHMPDSGDSRIKSWQVSAETEVIGGCHELPTVSNTTRKALLAAKSLGISWHHYDLNLPQLPWYCTQSVVLSTSTKKTAPELIVVLIVSIQASYCGHR